MILDIAITLALILVNGLLAGAEMAIVTIRPGRVRELVDAGRRSARVLQRLRADPERFLATVQVGITLVGATAAVVGGVSLADDLQPALERWPPIRPHARGLALGLVVTAITFLSVVFGELVPKSLALRSSERLALLMARPVFALSWLASPLVRLLALSSNLVLRPFRDRTSFVESRLSLEEVRSLVDEASEAGTVDRDAGEIASRALDLAGLTASDVMVHRRWVVGLPREASEDRIRDVLQRAGHRRIPIFEGTIDQIVGYVSWRDVVDRLWEGRKPVIDEMLRPAQFVAENTPAIDLLTEMQARRNHLAFVLDEHGGLAGIVTLEDLLEELVGEIVSEHAAATPETLRREADGSVVVAGTAAIRDIDRELDLKLDEIDDSTTMGGLCIALAGGRIPRTGEGFQAAPGVRIEVVEASTRRVRSVRLRLSPVAGAAPWTGARGT